MKKNLLSIIILALLIVNIVLTGIMMFSVTGTARKTSALIDDIATVMSLDLTNGAGDAAGELEAAVPMEDIEVYEIEEQLTIPLKKGADDDAHFAIVSVSLSMNKKDKGYKTYGSDMASKESLIKDAINEVVSSYTYEEAPDSVDDIRKEITSRIQSMFDSQFVFNISFRNIMFQ